jgi:hypothetical protein
MMVSLWKDGDSEVRHFAIDLIPVMLDFISYNFVFCRFLAKEELNRFLKHLKINQLDLQLLI